MTPVSDRPTSPILYCRGTGRQIFGELHRNGQRPGQRRSPQQPTAPSTQPIYQQRQTARRGAPWRGPVPRGTLNSATRSRRPWNRAAPGRRYSVGITDAGHGNPPAPRRSSPQLAARGGTPSIVVSMAAISSQRS
jgi:hypothetical protein